MSTFRNSVQLVGNVGADLELKSTKSGASLVKFSLATSESYTSSKGEKVKETQWHRIVAWGKTAEYMCNNVSKGSEILVTGKLTYNSYEDKDGIKRYVTEIKASEFKSFKRTPVSNEEVPF